VQRRDSVTVLPSYRLTEIGGAPENRTLDALESAAVFGTVSSSMPDVLLGGVSMAQPARHLVLGSTPQLQTSGEWSDDSLALLLFLKLAPQHGLAP
jgi:hypothetical protein